MKIPYGTVRHIHDELRNEINSAFESVLDSEWYIRGKECEAFEREFAEYCGAKHAVGCGNGLDAITIALLAYGIGPGDEVIVPAFTFVATAIAVERTGATPVLVDVEKETTLINPELIENAMTEKTKAIVPVHLYGQPVDICKIEKIAKKNNLVTIYDSAQAHGATYMGKGIGSYGDAVCFSFYPGKNLGALGDGGGIVTNSDKYELMRAVGNYGSEVRYHHDVEGMNSRLDEIQAAFLRVKLKNLDKVNLERKRIAEKYLKEINNKDVVLPVVKNGDHVWHIFPIHSEKRDKTVGYLSQKGIETNIHYPVPIHLQKSFKKYGLKEGSFPITEWLAKTELSLPLYYGMTDEEIDYVINTVNDMVV